MSLQEKVREITREARRAVTREIETRMAEAMVAGMDLAVWERQDFELKRGADSTLTVRVAFRLLPHERRPVGTVVPGLLPVPEGFDGGWVTCTIYATGGRPLGLA